MLQDLGPDTVDVTMETLASFWARDPCDLSDLGEKSCVWESPCVLTSPPPAGLMWTDPVSPHLQRNKQLQDTLLQRDEQLLRLQDENNKLREFLSSSFVRNLERTAKKLTTDGRSLKRNRTYVDDGSLQNLSHQLQTSQQVSKRVCRNLTTEFCSESSETSSSSSEPNLDLWVLRTLGLKDRDTIDTSNESSSLSGYNLSSLVYNAAESPFSEYALDSSFSPSVSSTPSSVHRCCQTPTQQTDYRRNAAERHEANCGNPAESPQICATSPGQRFTATGPTGQHEDPEAGIRSYSTSTAFRSKPPTEERPFNRSAGGAEICFITTLEGNPTKPPAYWSSLRGIRTPSRDTVQFSPPFSPISSSSPVVNQLWAPGGGGGGGGSGSPTTPSAGSQPPATPQTPQTPQTPRSRTDLAFSMSLSPSSSVKTHSFPQGQAFVRKDTEGRCNFTWVPTQRP